MATLELLLDHGGDAAGNKSRFGSDPESWLHPDDHVLYQALLRRYLATRETSTLLMSLLQHAVEAGRLEWLSQVHRELPALFDATFLADTDRSVAALMASARWPDPQALDFLQRSGLDPCMPELVDKLWSTLHVDSLSADIQSWLAYRYVRNGGVCGAGVAPIGTQ